MEFESILFPRFQHAGGGFSLDVTPSGPTIPSTSILRNIQFVNRVGCCAERAREEISEPGATRFGGLVGFGRMSEPEQPQSMDAVEAFDPEGVARVAPHTYRADIDPKWWVVRGPHGGYLAGIVLRAMLTELGSEAPPVRSFTTHFAAAPQVGRIDITTTVERRGRSLVFMSARTHQADRLIALSLAAFSPSWPGLSFDDAPMPAAPSPSESFPVPPTGDGVPPFIANFDMRWNIGARPFTGAERAEAGGWLRLKEPRIADACVVAVLLDAWPPSVFPKATAPVVAPTIDITMHFRTELPLATAAADDFYLGRFYSSMAADGFFEEDGHLWSAGGELVAQTRQLALGLTPAQRR
jgi:acyl-CoA thioesterase